MEKVYAYYIIGNDKNDIILSLQLSETEMLLYCTRLALWYV